MLGTVDKGIVIFYETPLNRITIPAKSIEPNVDLVRLVAGDQGKFINYSIATKAAGIIVEASILRIIVIGCYLFAFAFNSESSWYLRILAVILGILPIVALIIIFIRPKPEWRKKQTFRYWFNTMWIYAILIWFAWMLLASCETV